MFNVEITKKDLLSSFQDFEETHNIKKVRDDIPNKFIGRSPSKYYRDVDMDTKKLSKKVGQLLGKLYGRSL